jgi:hypothetical protein
MLQFCREVRTFAWSSGQVLQVNTVLIGIRLQINDKNIKMTIDSNHAKKSQHEILYILGLKGKYFYIGFEG